MSKKKEINSGDLVKIEPITDNQKLVFDNVQRGQEWVLLWMCWYRKNICYIVSVFTRCSKTRNRLR